MLKIGLTGGIGSGKTTAARLFEKRSITVIDADRIAHALVEPGGPALGVVVEQFGEHLVDDDGRLNRSKLREIVFSCPEQRRLLESIIHPLVYRAIEEKLADLDSVYCILSIPLLLETNQQERVDRVLVVDCPVKLQIDRVIERDSLSLDETRRILNTQVSREQRLRVADDVLSNTSTIEELDKQVEKLHNFYFSLSEQTGPPH
jgi:dephospho-CoA kinase